MSVLLWDDDAPAKENRLHFCIDHNGKMKGIVSISSSVLENPICQKRQCVEGSICQFCFAQNMLESYDNMRPCYKRNFEILNDHLLKGNEIPLINCAMVRIESFGDVGSVMHARNYIRIMRKNRICRFAAWSKNLAIWREAIRLEHGKPRNLSFVYSSMFINSESPCEDSFVDHVFTVYRGEFAEANGIEINCGAKSCLRCKRCYFGKAYHVAERLKPNSKPVRRSEIE